MVIQMLCTLPVDISLVCFSSRRPCVQLSKLATGSLPFVSSFVITNITSLLLSGHVQVLENTKDHM